MGGIISAGVQVSLFIAQWIFVLEILWISTIVVPFTIMSVTFFILDWLILDKLTTFLLSGNWDSVDTIRITSNSPIMIMLYVGIIFGFLFLIVFFINYFGRNLNGFNVSEIFKRLFWIFGFILFVAAVPFFLLFFSMFVKFCTSLISIIFTNNYLDSVLTNNPEIINFVQTLSNYQMGTLIDQTTWNNIWSQITDENLLAIKDKIYTSYNNIVKEMQALNWDSLIYELNNAANNPSQLKDIFNQNGVMDGLNQIYNNSTTLYQCLQTLNNSDQVNSDFMSSVCSQLGSLDGLPELEDFNNALNNLIMNGSIYQTIQINPETGKIISTSNIGFILYTAVTGIPVNSISGIWNNITFVSSLFRSNGIENLVKSIMLGGAVAIASAKGIVQLVTMLIYRWLWILGSVPYGAFATARMVNDNGAIFKLYFRETLSSFISLFVVALNLQIMTLLISLLSDGFKNGNIVISGLSGSQIAMSISFILIVIVSIYGTIAITQKVLEIFNNANIAKDNAINAIVNEYNSFKNNKNQRINRSTETRRQINKQINWNRRNKQSVANRRGGRNG